MRFARILSFALLSGLATAASAADVAKMLEKAERIRKTDKAEAQRLLDDAKRELAASPESRLTARAHLLECEWADAPAVAYRAVAAGLPLAERANDLVLQAKLIHCRGNARQFEGKVREAEADYAAAARLAARGKDRKVEVVARASEGWLQYNRGAMADALANLQAAYRISTQIGYEEGRLDSLTVMASVYADTNVAQYDRAIEYYRQLLVDYERLGKSSDVGDMLYNIGSTFEQKGHFAAAEEHYRRALAAFERLQQPEDVALTRRALGSALMKQGRAVESLPHFDAAVAFFQKQGNEGNVAYVRQFRGAAYRRLGRGPEALQDLAAAWRYYEKEGNTRFLERNAEETGLVYELLGDWRNAYVFRKRHAELGQQLAASRRDELASRLRVAFDAEKKEQENRALARENALRSAALREAKRNQTLQLAVIALTVLLAIALAVLFWRQVADTRRMRAMAMTDELTRLPNRRHILAAVEVAFAEAKRNGRPAALIVFDIDRFKRINDTYGHAAGDAVLQSVARACRLALRPADQLGRIGGEEFLIVLQDAMTAEHAYEIAERLRTAVERLDFDSIAEGLRVTISLGVRVANDYDVTAAIAAADELLYRAKEGGRNRVERATAAASNITTIGG